VFCSLLITIFFFPFFFFYKFNRHLCHGAYWCTDNPPHMPRLLHICILLSLIPAYVHLNMYTHNPAHRSILLSYYAYTHLPPSSRTLMLGLKYNYISQYILLPLLYEPAVPCYSLMLFLTCTCMYVHVHVCMYVHTYEFPVSLFVFVSYVYSFFHTGLYILCLAHCVLRVLFHIHNHFCSSKKKK